MHTPNSAKINRNQPCPCHSGKKFKHCCGSGSTHQPVAKRPDLLQLIQNARQHAFQRQDYAAAEYCYRQVLEIYPNNAEALAGIGQSLYWKHRRAEGRQYMTKAVKVLLRQSDKTESSMLLELSDQLQMWGEIELALQLIRVAIKKTPNNPKAHYGLAACLHRLNFTDQAIAAMNKLLKLLPNDSSCHILMALLEMDKKQFDSAQHRLERGLQLETDPLQQARIYLELSKVYDKQKRYDDAFTMAMRAGELHRQLPTNQAIDAEFIFNKLKHYKQDYDADLLQRWSSTVFEDDLPSPVFLLGFLRSGTTLTEQVLSAHPNIVTSDENQLLDEVIKALGAMTGIYDNPPAALRQITLDQAKELRRLYWERSAEEYGQMVYDKQFVNKVALNSIEIGFISCLFPEAKIIFALRDPRDVCLSCAMQSFTASVGTINMLSWEGIAKQYAAIMDLWLTLRHQIAPAYIELRYEDTVRDFEASFRRVFELLGLDWWEGVKQYHETVGGRFVSTPSFNAVSQPIYQSAVARWQNYAKHYASVQRLLEPYIEAFGYSEISPDL